MDPTGIPVVQAAVSRIEKRLDGEGRVVLRASGTEPVIRVMVEGRDEPLTRALATELAEVVRQAAGLSYHPAPFARVPSLWSRHASSYRRRKLENARLAGRERAAHRGADREVPGRSCRRLCVVCPPLVYLQDVARLLRGTAILLGAQDVCAEPQGAFTGEVSAAMLKDVGCSYVIVGHSERRLLYPRERSGGGAQVCRGAGEGPRADSVHGRAIGGARGGAYPRGGRAAA